MTLRMQREYTRIVRGLEKRGSTHRRAVAIYRNRSLGFADATLLFAIGNAAFDKVERYAGEVFTTCFMGFAKDCGVLEKSDDGDNCIEHRRVEASNAMMDKWPRSGRGRYKEWLQRLQTVSAVRMVRQYRHSSNPKLCRARTYVVACGASDESPAYVDRAALCTAARGAADRRTIHPRQGEHALLARITWGQPEITQRYGIRNAAWMTTLCAAYDTVCANLARAQTAW